MMKRNNLLFLCLCLLGITVFSSCDKDDDDFLLVDDPTKIVNTTNDANAILGSWQLYTNVLHWYKCIATTDENGNTHFNDEETFEKGDFWGERKWTFKSDKTWISQQAESNNPQEMSSWFLSKTENGRYEIYPEEGRLLLFESKTSNSPNCIFYYKIKNNVLYISTNGGEKYDWTFRKK